MRPEVGGGGWRLAGGGWFNSGCGAAKLKPGVHAAVAVLGQPRGAVRGRHAQVDAAAPPLGHV